MIKSANDCFMKPSSRVELPAAWQIMAWCLKMITEECELQAQRCRLAERTTELSNLEAMRRLQLFNHAKLKNSRLPRSWNDHHGSRSAESDQARMGGRALKHRSSAHHCQSLFKLSVSRAFYLGHRFDAGAPLSSDHTVLWPLRFRRHSGSGRHGEARCREEIAYYRNVEEVSWSL